jgi:hypothetical protein
VPGEVQDQPRRPFDPLRGVDLAARMARDTAILELLLGVLAPRLARWSRWPTRLRGRRLLGYVVVNALLVALVNHWLAPWFARQAERQARVVDELREELGREPAGEEVVERLRRDLTQPS